MELPQELVLQPPAAYGADGAAPFAMTIRLTPELRAALIAAHTAGDNVTLKMGQGPAGTVLRIGKETYQFNTLPEASACDCYEETGAGVLLQVGTIGKKLHVARDWDADEKTRASQRGQEAVRKQKERKALLLDHHDKSLKLGQPAPPEGPKKRSAGKAARVPMPKRSKTVLKSAAPNVPSKPSTPIGAQPKTPPIVQDAKLRAPQPADTAIRLKPTSEAASAQGPVPKTSPVGPELKRPQPLEPPPRPRSDGGLSAPVTPKEPVMKPDSAAKPKPAAKAAKDGGEFGKRTSNVDLTFLRNHLLDILAVKPLSIAALERAVFERMKKSMPTRQVMERVLKGIALYRSPGLYHLTPEASKEVPQARTALTQAATATTPQSMDTDTDAGPSPLATANSSRPAAVVSPVLQSAGSKPATPEELELSPPEPLLVQTLATEPKKSAKHGHIDSKTTKSKVDGAKVHKTHKKKTNAEISAPEKELADRLQHGADAEPAARSHSKAADANASNSRMYGDEPPADNGHTEARSRTEPANGALKHKGLGSSATDVNGNARLSTDKERLQNGGTGRDTVRIDTAKLPISKLRMKPPVEPAKPSSPALSMEPGELRSDSPGDSDREAAVGSKVGIQSKRDKVSVSSQRANGGDQNSPAVEDASEVYWSFAESSEPVQRGPITSEAQYHEYVEEYNSKYPTYFRLDQDLLAISNEFSTLNRKLTKCQQEGDRQELQTRVQVLYKQRKQRAARMKAAFNNLHSELEILKRHVKSFVSASSG